MQVDIASCVSYPLSSRDTFSDERVSYHDRVTNVKVMPSLTIQQMKTSPRGLESGTSITAVDRILTVAGNDALKVVAYTALLVGLI